jgi:uncharacterized protein
MSLSSYEPEIGIVIESSPQDILVEIESVQKFETYKNHLQVGKYLRIANGPSQFIIVNIEKISSNYIMDENNQRVLKFLISTQPVGTIDEEHTFERGNTTLPIPTEKVYIVTKDSLEAIFSPGQKFSFPFGKLAQSKDIELNIDADSFFGKHIAVVGSTGSGKSCTVARMLQQVMGLKNGKNDYKDLQRNSHIIIFDLHSEYTAAFDLEDDQKFGLNLLNESNLILPYWLMNADELEAMFIEGKDTNVHNQRSQFRQAVIQNKEKHNPQVEEVTYDTPIYFNLDEVKNFITNLNNEVIGKLEWEDKPKLENGTLVMDRNVYFDKIYAFAHTSDDPGTRAVPGPFYGDFDKFLLNLETRTADKRLKFLFNPSEANKPYTSLDFKRIMKQFLGYNNYSNITIVDLSGIPFEVLTITVSLVSRLVFDFCFHLTKLQHYRELLNEVPVLIVCEEAHNYAPRNDDDRYKASKNSLEKIVKEGRKYGLSIMVVSQRPSEVSETIFAQCNNFIALRLTNINDQEYIKNLMSDISSSIADVLPNLAPGEFMITGDAVLLPCVARVDKPFPEPTSQSVKFLQEWNKEWREVDFDNVINRWRKEKLNLDDVKTEETLR